MTIATSDTPIPDAPWQGACLYLPATHPALPRVVDGTAIDGLSIAVVCLEDALREADVVEALRRTQAIRMEGSGSRPRLFIRPRNITMLREILEWLPPQLWSGVVLPKVTAHNIRDWLEACRGSGFALMPTLETADVFDPFCLADMVAAIMQPEVRRQVEAVRMGATDLFGVLGTRRPFRGTLYESALGPTLCSVANLLMARGFSVSAPVFERIEPGPDFAEEIVRDVQAGFVGKTAIHPVQVAAINNAYRVSPMEFEQAQRVLADVQAVFAADGMMCEVRPHERWARRIVSRAEAFGIAHDAGPHQQRSV